MSNSRLDGVRKGTRIPDLLLRRQSLYPTELYGPCCQSTVASGAISQDDLNSQQNYRFSADSCSPFFLGGVCSIQLSYCDMAKFMIKPEETRT